MLVSAHAAIGASRSGHDGAGSSPLALTAPRPEAAIPLHDRAEEPAGAVHVPLRLAAGADAGKLQAEVGHGAGLDIAGG